MFTHASLAAILMACAALAQAQAWPTQPIRLIVPWPPGGGVDTSARIIAPGLSERLGQNVVIENKPGAAGNIGTEFAARARPDGYTLVMASSSPNAINVHLYARLAFDPIKDFAPIAMVAEVPNVLVVPANSPANSALQLIEQAFASNGAKPKAGTEVKVQAAK